LVPQRFFVGYARPRKTPGELGTTAALFAAVSLGLVVVGRRRNRRLAPPAERVEARIVRRFTPRYAAANLLFLIVYGVPFLAVVAWLPSQLSDRLFSRALFSADFALWAAWLGLLCPAVWALALSGMARRLTVSRDGLLIGTWGFGHLLRPERIAVVECGVAPLWMWGLRHFTFGGDAQRWVRVRTKSGRRLWLAVRDPDQFLRDAAHYLGEAVVVAQEPPSTAPEMPPATPEASPGDS
jgi:hypothetical protein